MAGPTAPGHATEEAASGKSPFTPAVTETPEVPAGRFAVPTYGGGRKAALALPGGAGFRARQNTTG